MIFGKCTGTTYEEMFLTDPAYCNWVMTTVDAGESESFPALHRLAHHIHLKRMAQTFEADDADLEM